MNDAWKTKLEERASSVEFLDVWHLSMTRPDAHKNPPFDCLHFFLTQELPWMRVSRNQTKASDGVHAEMIHLLHTANLAFSRDIISKLGLHELDGLKTGIASERCILFDV